MWINKSVYDANIKDAEWRGKTKAEAEIGLIRQNEAQARMALESAKKEIEGLKSKLRDQAKAEMLLAAIKVIMTSLETTPSKTQEERIKASYQLMLAAQQSMSTYYPDYGANSSAMGGLLGGLR